MLGATNHGRKQPIRYTEPCLQLVAKSRRPHGEWDSHAANPLRVSGVEVRYSQTETQADISMSRSGSRRVPSVVVSWTR